MTREHTHPRGRRCSDPNHKNCYYGQFEDRWGIPRQGWWEIGDDFLPRATLEELYRNDEQYTKELEDMGIPPARRPTKDDNQYKRNTDPKRVMDKYKAARTMKEYEKLKKEQKRAMDRSDEEWDDFIRPPRWAVPDNPGDIEERDREVERARQESKKEHKPKPKSSPYSHGGDRDFHEKPKSRNPIHTPDNWWDNFLKIRNRFHLPEFNDLPQGNPIKDIFGDNVNLTNQFDINHKSLDAPHFANPYASSRGPGRSPRGHLNDVTSWDIQMDGGGSDRLSMENALRAINVPFVSDLAKSTARFDYWNRYMQNSRRTPWNWNVFGAQHLSQAGMFNADNFMQIPKTPKAPKWYRT